MRQGVKGNVRMPQRSRAAYSGGMRLGDELSRECGDNLLRNHTLAGQGERCFSQVSDQIHGVLVGSKRRLRRHNIVRDNHV